MIDLSGRVALVSGASRGIGSATARELARAGCKVAVNYLRDRARAEQTCASIQEGGGHAHPFQCDVTDDGAIQEMAEAIANRWGPVEVLINNAGEIIRPGEWDQASSTDTDQTISLNLTSTLKMMRTFAPPMVELGWGRIVNVSTTYAITGAAPVLAYTAAKAGIISATYAMARQLGPSGITVNAVAPGNVDTDMSKGAGPDFENWVNSTTPLGRIGKASEVAEAVRFLVQAEYITGHVLVVDGGHILNM